MLIIIVQKLTSEHVKYDMRNPSVWSSTLDIEFIISKFKRTAPRSPQNALSRMAGWKESWYKNGKRDEDRRRDHKEREKILTHHPMTLPLPIRLQDTIRRRVISRRVHGIRSSLVEGGLWCRRLAYVSNTTAYLIPAYELWNFDIYISSERMSQCSQSLTGLGRDGQYQNLRETAHPSSRSPLSSPWFRCPNIFISFSFSSRVYLFGKAARQAELQLSWIPLVRHWWFCITRSNWTLNYQNQSSAPSRALWVQWWTRLKLTIMKSSM